MPMRSFNADISQQNSNESSPLQVAFVDVDETLVREITFLSLFSHDTHARGADASETIRTFRELRAAGMSRTESHRWFYRLWAGRSVHEVRERGCDWFALRAANRRFFNLAVLQRLAEMAAAGTRIVLVSGSFDAALTPIARHVGADAVLCTTLTEVDGRYTGAVEATMVGPDKGTALRDYAEGTGADLSACAAFGDHHSDSAMFELVGHPVIVGDADPLLTDYPAERLPG